MILVMMMNNNFAAFILTHGRPEKVYTYNALKKANYTGKIFLIIDNEDKFSDKYIEIYGKENVIIFNKLEISKKFDQFDNFEERRSIVYARNASFEIADKLGLDFFIQLDDDYTDFRYKYDNNLNYKDKINPKNLDKLFDIILEFYKNIPAKAICIAQGGDFIGGKNGSLARNLKLKRKAMNTFFCSTKRKFKFIGRINEDVNTYTSYQSKGNLFFTIPNLAINQLMTQTNSGGMADMYLESGTYIKSFYTIICQPSSVYINLMGSINKRLHHRISWKNTVPVILSEDFKK
jgi:hypothetical protein